MDPLRAVHPILTAKEHAAVMAIRGTPQELPGQSFDHSRLALWRCRACAPWGTWNEPARTHCRTVTCAAPRS